MLPSPASMDMLARDGANAAAQPNFLYALERRYESTLNGGRLQHINPVAKPLTHGMRLAFTSDNLPIGPMVGMYVAIIRRGPDGKEFAANEALSRGETIRLYIVDAS